MLPSTLLKKLKTKSYDAPMHLIVGSTKGHVFPLRWQTVDGNGRGRVHVIFARFPTAVVTAGRVAISKDTIVP